MLNKLIIIPSYLPDNKYIREQRFIKLNNLIRKCDELFNLHIYILIQNYREEEIRTLVSLSPNVEISFNYSRLGIAKAREQLRQDVISSIYDYFIFLDDDSELEGDKKSAQAYLNELDAHPQGFAQYGGRVMKLFVISKFLFSKVGFEDYSVEDGEAFEDRVFVAKLDKNYYKYRFRFKDMNLRDTCKGYGDALSTWYQNRNDFGSIMGNTQRIIECLKKN